MAVMSSEKLQRIAHLSAVQGAAEKRPEPYLWYGEDASQASNAAMRQEHLRGGRLRRTTGRRGE